MKARAFDLQKTYRGEWVLMVTLTEDSVREAMNLVDHAKDKVYEILCKIFRHGTSSEQSTAKTLL